MSLAVTIPFIERMPAEVRLHLLHGLQHSDVKRLISVSPVWHTVYMENSRAYLGRALNNTLDDPMLAVYVYRSSLPSFLEQRTAEGVREFLANVKSSQRNKRLSWSSGLTDLEIIRITDFHFSFIEIFANEYVYWALMNAYRYLAPDTIAWGPTRAEMKRIVRSVYLFQLLCNLWGKGNPETDSSEILTTMNEVLLPWDLARVVSVYQYVREFYRRVVSKFSVLVETEGNAVAAHAYGRVHWIKFGTLWDITLLLPTHGVHCLMALYDNVSDVRTAKAIFEDILFTSDNGFAEAMEEMCCRVARYDYPPPYKRQIFDVDPPESWKAICNCCTKDYVFGEIKWWDHGGIFWLGLAFWDMKRIRQMAEELEAILKKIPLIAQMRTRTKNLTQYWLLSWMNDWMNNGHLGKD